MISLNILPDDLRPKTEAEVIPIKSLFRYFIYLLAGFACLHGLIILITLFKFFEMNYYKKNWPKIEPQITKLESLKKEETSLEANAKIIDELTRKNISWSVGLNQISKALPTGVWLEDFNLKENSSFVIKGKVVSRNQDAMIILNKFITGLRSVPDFISIELGPVKNINFRKQEVMSFDILGKAK
jgi:Tfp pilus assembly protein PilN